jgi:hypothetical protein
MTSRSDFSDEEWTQLKRAPFIAGMAISLADPGGPIEAVKETAATLRTVVGAAEGPEGELVAEIAREVAADAKARKSPLAGFKPPRGVEAGVEILEALRAANRIASEKATADEAEAFRAWLLAAAREAADAAKEGGFPGFHAQRVSEGETRMLERLDEVLAAPAP